MPRDVVQFVRCPDDEVGRHLVTHDGVNTVVLTGAYDTARMFLDWKPRLTEWQRQRCSLDSLAPSPDQRGVR